VKGTFSTIRKIYFSIWLGLWVGIPGIGLAQEKPVYKIGIMADYKTEESRAILEIMQANVQAVVGEDADIVFPQALRFFHNFKQVRAAENYQRLVDSEADFILAFGQVSSALLHAREDFPKPTLLFGTGNVELNQVDIRQTRSGKENFAYLLSLQSYAEDLKTFFELTEFKEVGIAMEAQLVDQLPVKQIFDSIFTEIESNYRLIPFFEVQDIRAGMDGVDALYLAGGFFLSNSDIRELATTCISLKIPAFTNTSVEDVGLGLLGTNRSEETIAQLIRHIALTIESWVNGGALSEEEVLIDFGSILSLNFNTARAIDLPLKYSLITRTKFLGELKNTGASVHYSLVDLIGLGLNENLGLKFQEKEVALSQQDLRQAQSDYIPNLSANADLTIRDPNATIPPLFPQYSADGSLALQQTVFSLQANASIGIQRNLQLAQEAQLNAAQLDAVLEASNLYFNALLNKVNVQIQQQNLELTRQNLKIAQQNFDAGYSGKTDVLRFRSQLTQNTQTLIESLNAMQQSFIDINQYTNSPINSDIDVVEANLGEGVFERYGYRQFANLLDQPELREPFVVFLMEEAKKNSPELEGLEYSFKAVERNYKVNALGRILPTLSLQAAWNQNFDSWGTNGVPRDPKGFYNAGLNLRLPLINQYRTELNRQTAQIQMEQIEIDKQNLSLSIERNVNRGVLNLINQTSNIELSELNEEAARESLELVQAAYAEGAVNIIQLIDAQNNYLEAQLAKAGATYNFLITAIQLERFIGYNFLLHTEAENLEFENRFQQFLEAYQDE
jgi:outer membrane protein TolC